MYHMKYASIRDLRYQFSKIERLLREGQDIQLTKRNKVIARIVPAQNDVAQLPDFASRLREIYGSKTLKASGAELLSRDRGRF